MPDAHQVSAWSSHHDVCAVWVGHLADRVREDAARRDDLAGGRGGVKTVGVSMRMGKESPALRVLQQARREDLAGKGGAERSQHGWRVRRGWRIQHYCWARTVARAHFCACRACDGEVED
jgi:hypothetical protein